MSWGKKLLDAMQKLCINHDESLALGLSEGKGYSCAGATATDEGGTIVGGGRAWRKRRTTSDKYQQTGD